MCMQELAPKHAQIHATLDLFPGLTALDLSGMLMQTDQSQTQSPVPIRFLKRKHACRVRTVYVGMYCSLQNVLM